MVRPTPPVIGQGSWGQPVLDSIDYAADTAEAAVAGLAAKADSSALATGLANKANTSHTHTIANVTSLQTSLDAKAPLASPTFTGTVAGVTKTHVGLSSVDNTADADKPVSSAQQAALNGKLTDASSQTTRWRGIYANQAALPVDGAAGDFAITLA